MSIFCYYNSSRYYFNRIRELLLIYFDYLWWILACLPLIAVIVIFIKTVFNINKKARYSNDMAKGLDAIIEKYVDGENDKQFIRIDSIYSEVEYFYNQYVETNISAKKFFPNIAIWSDYISMTINLQTNRNQIHFKRLFSKLGVNKYFDCLYDKMSYVTEIQNYIHRLNPFYKATPYQQYLLKDIIRLEDNNSSENVTSIVQKVESEFLRLESDIKTNKKNNKISIFIGALGIIVSIFLSIINFA